MEPRRKVTSDWSRLRAFAQKYKFSYFTTIDVKSDPNNDLDRSNQNDFCNNIFKNKYYIHHEFSDGDCDTYYLFKLEDIVDEGNIDIDFDKEYVIFEIQLDHLYQYV